MINIIVIEQTLQAARCYPARYYPFYEGLGAQDQPLKFIAIGAHVRKMEIPYNYE